MGCGVTVIKKILVLTYDDQYLKATYKIITNKDFEIKDITDNNPQDNDVAPPQADYNPTNE